MRVSLLRWFVVFGLPALAAPATATTLEHVSVTTIAAPIDSNGSSDSPLAVSRDGRYALFSSEASNLVPGDSNRLADLFIYDAQADSVERVSLGNGGTQADAAFIGSAAVSDDGRYVFFGSAARNLVAGVNQGIQQIYVRDRVAATTQLVSRDGNGQPFGAATSLLDASSDGRYILLSTPLSLDGVDSNTVRDLYRLDRSTGQTVLVTIAANGAAADRDTAMGQLSSDGRHAVFETAAGNLVANDTNAQQDVFLRDLDGGTTLLVSRMTSGAPIAGSAYPYLPTRSNALSDDGRYVAFNLGFALDPADTNGTTDGYLFDRNSASVRRVTLRENGAQIDVWGGVVRSLSADGATAIMESAGIVTAPDQIEGFSRSYRLSLGTMALSELLFRAPLWGDETRACGLAGEAAAAYCTTRAGSSFTFLDIHRLDLQQPGARRVSRPLALPSAYANHDSSNVSVSADGRFVAFESQASNLVVGDLNGGRDVFVRDRLTGTTARINHRADGGESNCNGGNPQISANGRYVAFDSCDALAPPATWGSFHIFRHDRQTGETLLISRNASGDAANSWTQMARISDDGSVVVFRSPASNLTADAPNPNGDYYARDVNAGTTTLVTRNAGGVPSGSPGRVYLSGDGLHVLFSHNAPDLVAGDTNGEYDAFVFDRLANQIQRVSVDASGQQIEHGMGMGISHDGSKVLFISSDPDLGSGGYLGHYVRDRATGSLELVSRNSAGEPLQRGGTESALSADGNLVALRAVGSNDGIASPPLRWEGIFVFDRSSQRLQLLTPAVADAAVEQLAFSASGKHLVFSSRASNLVADDGNNRYRDVFLLSDFVDRLFADGFQPH